MRLKVRIQRYRLVDKTRQVCKMPRVQKRGYHFLNYIFEIDPSLF
jgi:hypothetical protein